MTTNLDSVLLDIRLISHANKGKWDSVREVAKASGIPPTSAGSKLALGLALLKSSDWNPALPLIESACNTVPENPRIRLESCKALLEQCAKLRQSKDQPIAEKLLLLALKLDPENSVAREMKNHLRHGLPAGGFFGTSSPIEPAYETVSAEALQSAFQSRDIAMQQWESELHNTRNPALAHTLAISYYWMAIQESHSPAASDAPNSPVVVYWQKAICCWAMTLNSRTYIENWIRQRIEVYGSTAPSAKTFVNEIKQHLLKEIERLATPTVRDEVRKRAPMLYAESWMEFEAAELFADCGEEVAYGPNLFALLGVPSATSVPSQRLGATGLILGGKEFPFLTDLEALKEIFLQRGSLLLAILCSPQLTASTKAIRQAASQIPADNRGATTENMIVYARLERFQQQAKSLAPAARVVSEKEIQQYFAEMEQLLVSLQSELPENPSDIQRRCIRGCIQFLAERIREVFPLRGQDAAVRMLRIGYKTRLLETLYKIDPIASIGSDLAATHHQHYLLLRTSQPAEAIEYLSRAAELEPHDSEIQEEIEEAKLSGLLPTSQDKTQSL